MCFRGASDSRSGGVGGMLRRRISEIFRRKRYYKHDKMADDKKLGARIDQGPIVFGQRLAGSDMFRILFREGMALVEETASYLDGDRRAERSEEHTSELQSQSNLVFR